MGEDRRSVSAKSFIYFKNAAPEIRWSARRGNKVLLNGAREEDSRRREEAIGTRRKPRTKEIAIAKVGGKNPDKLKKSIIAITLAIRVKRQATDDVRVYASSLSENARELLAKKELLTGRFTACNLTNNLHENEVPAFSSYL